MYCDGFLPGVSLCCVAVIQRMPLKCVAERRRLMIEFMAISSLKYMTNSGVMPIIFYVTETMYKLVSWFIIPLHAFSIFETH